MLLYVILEMASQLNHIKLFKSDPLSSADFSWLCCMSGSRFNLSVDDISVSIKGEPSDKPRIIELKLNSTGFKSEIKHQHIWTALSIDSMHATSDLHSMKKLNQIVAL